MGPPSYMQSVVDRNVVMRRIPVLILQARFFLHSWLDMKFLERAVQVPRSITKIQLV